MTVCERKGKKKEGKWSVRVSYDEGRVEGLFGTLIFDFESLSCRRLLLILKHIFIFL